MAYFWSTAQKAEKRILGIWSDQNIIIRDQGSTGPRKLSRKNHSKSITAGLFFFFFQRFVVFVSNLFFSIFKILLYLNVKSLQTQHF